MALTVFRCVLRRNFLSKINIKRYFSIREEDLIYENLKGENKGVVVLGLNRAKQKNAFSTGLVRQLNSALENVSNDSDIRVLVIRSMVPGIFCAGETLLQLIVIYS